jgi:hypothetical protein
MSESKVVIPDAAVESAAMAYCADLTQLGHPRWEDLRETGRGIRLEVMRAALEAAAPHLTAADRADTWDEGNLAGREASHRFERTNPYR